MSEKDKLDIFEHNSSTKELKYCSLHQHSDASFLDSCNKPEDLAKKAAEIGMPAIALSDHGSCHNFVKMSNACKKAGVKFIPGCEFYFTHDHKKKERKSRHITILCMNNEGLETIYKLTSLANSPLDQDGGFFYRPRIDWKNLEEHNKGLICLTGCMNSPVNHEFGRNKDYGAGKDVVEHLVGIFGKDRLFVELQMVNDPLDSSGDRRIYIEEQDIIYEWDRRVAKDLGLRTVATNDSHYLNEEDSFVHEILKCLDAKATLKTPVVDHAKGVTKGRLVFNGFDYHVKSTEEMQAKFTDKEIAMTQKIADMCNVEFDSTPHMPMFETDMTHKKAHEMIVAECRKGWLFRKINQRENKDKYIQRIKTELADMASADLANYFLIVWDVLRYCREQLIPIGPGRGSAAGSLVAYLLQITQVDPLEHGLIWERFWNRGRIGSMPDIDVDVSIRHKSKIVEYIKEKFGRDRVFPMMSITTLTTAAVLKDVGKALGLSFEYMNKLTKHLPHKCKNIEDAIDRDDTVKAASEGEDEEIKEWQKALDAIKDGQVTNATIDYMQRISDRKKSLKQTFQIAKRLEGCAKNRGTHACALLIYDKPVFGKVPLCWDAKKKQQITGFDMYDLEELGCLKLDILGLKTLDVIADSHPEGAKCLYDPDRYFGPWDDPKVYELLAKGRSKGIFQLESSLGRAYCKRIKPKNLNELCDLGAILRPAVLEPGLDKDYIKNRASDDCVVVHEDLRPVFEPTNGIMLFQEQLIAMVKIIGGFDLAEADAIRKACGKKLPEKMKTYKEKFVNGALKNGYKQELADELWSWILSSAGYSFNKSHSMCYSGYLGYITCWLKIHHPERFMLGLLKFSKDESDSSTEIMELFYDAKLSGVTILPPCVKEGNTDFELVDKTIHFGLSHIKHIGGSSLKSLAKLKDMSWIEILTDPKLGVKKDIMQALILSGAFDYFGITRKIMNKQFEYMSQLTGKSPDLFRTFVEGGTLKKETKKDGLMTYEVESALSFHDSVMHFKAFMLTENPKMKMVNVNVEKKLIGWCESYLSCMINMKNVEEFGPREKAGYETYYLSVALTCSEVDIYAGDYRQTHNLIQAEGEFDKVAMCIIALINRVHERQDKNGNGMAFVGLQDGSFQLDAVMFNKNWAAHRHQFAVGKILMVEGIKNRGGFIINHAEELE